MVIIIIPHPLGNPIIIPHSPGYLVIITSSYLTLWVISSSFFIIWVILLSPYLILCVITNIPHPRLSIRPQVLNPVVSYHHHTSSSGLSEDRSGSSSSSSKKSSSSFSTASLSFLALLAGFPCEKTNIYEQIINDFINHSPTFIFTVSLYGYIYFTRAWKECDVTQSMRSVEPIDLQRINTVHVYYISKFFKWIFTFICTRYLCCGFLSFLCCFGFCLLLKQRRTKNNSQLTKGTYMYMYKWILQNIPIQCTSLPNKKDEIPLLLTWAPYYDMKNLPWF